MKRNVKTLKNQGIDLLDRLNVFFQHVHPSSSASSTKPTTPVNATSNWQNDAPSPLLPLLIDLFPLFDALARIEGVSSAIYNTILRTFRVCSSMGPSLQPHLQEIMDRIVHIYVSTGDPRALDVISSFVKKFTSSQRFFVFPFRHLMCVLKMHAQPMANTLGSPM